jgi:hypothetical protein
VTSGAGAVRERIGLHCGSRGVSMLRRGASRQPGWRATGRALNLACGLALNLTSGLALISAAGRPASMRVRVLTSTTTRARVSRGTVAGSRAGPVVAGARAG